MAKFVPYNSIYKTDITCKACNEISTYESEEDLQNKVCKYCGHNFGAKITSYIDDTQNASSETHIRYKWFCNKCESKGIKWIERGLHLENCPKCNSQMSFKAAIQINSDIGACKTIWDSMDIKEINPYKSLKKLIIPDTVGKCRSCDHEYVFKLMPPYRCRNCGEIGQNFRQQSPSGITCQACGFIHPKYMISETCLGCGRRMIGVTGI
jgi:hypothetical protein